MSYKIIKGEFHIFYPEKPKSGPEPDGDTLKFLPYKLEDTKTFLSHKRPVAINKNNMITLRFEGIDALETHFAQTHQNLRWAHAARDVLLEMVGFTDIVYWPELPHKVKSVKNHPQKGYIIAKTLDTHGRVISFVYPGETDIPDGTELDITSELLQKSFNYKLLEKGLVYPIFYMSLPQLLRQEMKAITIKARDTKIGMWEEETVTPNVWGKVPDLVSLQKLVMWPKLFRRLSRYFQQNKELAQFIKWLEKDERGNDSLIIGDEQYHMHDIVEVDGDKMRMKYLPEDIIIYPK